MATNRDLLKEAIADAKAVKEMAIANAKAALEEAFTPQLKTMLSAKLQEMELEEEKEVDEAEIDEAGFGDNDTLNTMAEKKDDDSMMEVDLEELLAELAEEEDKMNETEINESEITEEEMEDESRAERADVDKYEYEKGKEAGEDEGEALDLEDMTDEDLKKFIEDVISDMVETGELEAGEGAEEEEGGDMETVDVDVDVEELDEEVDLAELLKEIEDLEEDVYSENDPDINSIQDVDEAEEDKVKEGKIELERVNEEEMGEIDPEIQKLIDAAENETLKTDKSEVNEIIGAAAITALGLKFIPFGKLLSGVVLKKIGFILSMSSIPAYLMKYLVVWLLEVTATGVVVGAATKKLINLAMRIPKVKAKYDEEKDKLEDSEKVQEDLYEAYDTIKILKKELNEINLLNAKLLYTNKIFKSKNLTESQKVKVLGSFDNANTVKETKLVFETLNESIKVKKPLVEKTLGRASKSTNTPKNVKKPIVESNEAYLRMQKLAGLIK
jgi:hypothetical protein